jgi:hypothetical protein
MRRYLERWPLVIVGLGLIGWAVAKSSSSEGRAYLLGIGALLLGAGLALIIRHDVEDAHPRRRRSSSSEDVWKAPDVPAYP